MFSKLHLIRCALISTSDKTGLEALVQCLVDYSVHIISTGGTADFLREKGFPVTDISLHTGFEEILGGRVKTLHPFVFGGLLGKQNDIEHQTTMKTYGISPVDIAIINFYPFTKFSDNEESAIEHIDIGGPAMVRAAAKNHENVTVVTNPNQYADVIEELKTNQGFTSFSFRKKLAWEAFIETMSYDNCIQSWFYQKLSADAFPYCIGLTGKKVADLRYGENSHQKSALYQTTGSGVVLAQQLNGKQLSYNNICDANAAWSMVSQFDDPAVIVIKHGNPCVASIGKNCLDAWNRGIKTDPISAFGGIIAFNVALDAETVEVMMKSQFFELILAPRFLDGALTLLKKKKNIRVLIPKPIKEELHFQKVIGGFLVQMPDNKFVRQEDCIVPTKTQPTDEQWRDLLFAEKIVRFVKSNAIILARDNRLVGLGCGQTNRADSVHMAIYKAQNMLGTAGSVAASDAFFPFKDGPQALIDAGVTAVIQPGGSLRDNEVIELLDSIGIPMVFTRVRHFLH